MGRLAETEGVYRRGRSEKSSRYLALSGCPVRFDNGEDEEPSLRKAYYCSGETYLELGEPEYLTIRVQPGDRMN